MYLKNTFKRFVENDTLPNILLTGTPGVGKTTVARAAINEIGSDLLFVNGSLDSNIDTLRNRIRDFASTIAFNRKRKYVLIDEADHLNANSTQPGLRSFMEEHALNCGFIMTCNQVHRIIEPLHSRFSEIEFRIPPDERPALAKQMVPALYSILEKEGVKFSKDVVNQLIVKYFPDMRKMVNELQRHSAGGEITTDALSSSTTAEISELWAHIKSKDWKSIRTWSAQNQFIPAFQFYEGMYEYADKLLKPESVGNAVLVLGEYMKRHPESVSPQINIACCALELMNHAQFK
jgi:DNA polymerase III delta prime subunit